MRISIRHLCGPGMRHDRAPRRGGNHEVKCTGHWGSGTRSSPAPRHGFGLSRVATRARRRGARSSCSSGNRDVEGAGERRRAGRSSVGFAVAGPDVSKEEGSRGSSPATGGLRGAIDTCFFNNAGHRGPDGPMTGDVGGGTSTAWDGGQNGPAACSWAWARAVIKVDEGRRAWRHRHHPASDGGDQGRRRRCTRKSRLKHAVPRAFTSSAALEGARTTSGSTASPPATSHNRMAPRT